MGSQSVTCISCWDSVPRTACGSSAEPQGPSAAACGGRKTGDLLTVAQLLTAANVSLDDAVPGGHATKRGAGLTFVVNIEYTAGLGGDGYTYSVNSSALEEGGKVFFGAFTSTFDAAAGASREVCGVHSACAACDLCLLKFKTLAVYIPAWV